MKDELRYNPECIEITQIETVPMKSYGRMCVICCEGFELSSCNDVRTICPNCVDKIRTAIGVRIKEWTN